MPQHVLDKLANKNIGLEQIKRKVKDSDMTPQDLFQMDSGKERIVSSWSS